MASTDIVTDHPQAHAYIGDWATSKVHNAVCSLHLRRCNAARVTRASHRRLTRAQFIMADSKAILKSYADRYSTIRASRITKRPPRIMLRFKHGENMQDIEQRLGAVCLPIKLEPTTSADTTLPADCVSSSKPSKRITLPRETLQATLSTFSPAKGAAPPRRALHQTTAAICKRTARTKEERVIARWTRRTEATKADRRLARQKQSREAIAFARQYNEDFELQLALESGDGRGILAHMRPHGGEYFSMLSALNRRPGGRYDRFLQHVRIAPSCMFNKVDSLKLDTNTTGKDAIAIERLNWLLYGLAGVLDHVQDY